MSLRARHRVRVGRALWQAGILRPMRPDRMARSLTMLHRWGASPAIAYALAAIRQPDRAAIIDDRGTLTFAQVHLRTNALARSLRAAGVAEHDTVAIMCRNHRWFIEATVACSKLGARLLYLDTDLDARQVAETTRREDAVAAIYDEDLADVVQDGTAGCKRFIAWHEDVARPRPFALEELIADAEDSDPAPPCEGPPTVSIASAADGSESHMSSRVSSSLVGPSPLLSVLPLGIGQTTVMAAPMCHPWGYVQMKLAMRLASTLVLRRDLDPERVLGDVERHHATAIVLLAEMLEQIVALAHQSGARHDTSSLRVIAVNGATLPGELAIPAIQAFGAVLYNLQGQSEVCLDGYWGSRSRQTAGALAAFGAPRLPLADRRPVVRRMRRG